MDSFEAQNDLRHQLSNEEAESLLRAARQMMFVEDPKRKEVIDRLPTLTEADVRKLGHHDSNCPICFTPFLAILAEEEMASAMDSPALSTQDLGVTKLAETCGHLFCRKDISTWIRLNDGCPTCRTPFINHDEGEETASQIPASGLLQEVLSDRQLRFDLFSILTDDGRIRPSSSDPFANSQHPERDEFAGMYT